MTTISVEIPKSLNERLAHYQHRLPEIIERGLEQLENEGQQKELSEATLVTQALIKTGRIQHLSAHLVDEIDDDTRQPPPTLSGVSASDIVINQRRGQM